MLIGLMYHNEHGNVIGNAVIDSDGIPVVTEYLNATEARLVAALLLECAEALEAIEAPEIALAGEGVDTP